jgi:hypothetical protein
MGMICYLYQNWEEQDRIRYEISYGKGLIDWSLSFRSFAGQKLVPSAIPGTAVPGYRMPPRLRLEHGLSHLDGVATKMVSQRAL